MNAADAAWEAILGDTTLRPLLKRVSINEVRLLIGHALDAALTPLGDAGSTNGPNAGRVAQGAIYAWEAAPSHMVGRFRLWSEVPEKEKAEWRAIAKAALQGE